MHYWLLAGAFSFVGKTISFMISFIDIYPYSGADYGVSTIPVTGVAF